MSKQKNMRRIESAMVEMNRLTRSGRGDNERSRRAGVELTGAGQRLLQQVGEYGPVRLAHLARRTNTDPGIVTRQVDTLEAEGLGRDHKVRQRQAVFCIIPEFLG